MINVIENFDDSTDWTLSDPTITVSDESIFIFDTGTALKIQSGADMQGETISKILSSAIDLTNYSEIRFQVRSRDISNFKFTQSDDFYLIIELSTDGQPTIYKWYVPIYEMGKYNCIALDVTDITSFDTITIKFNNNLDRAFWFDYMVAIEPELEFDLLFGITNLLHEQIVISLGNLGQDATAGDSSILLTDDSFLVVGSLIRITEGAVTEYHQLSGVPMSLSINFTELKDGQTLQNSFTTSAEVNLVVPAEFRNIEKEIFLPGITIWGFNPERAIDRDDEVDVYFDYAEDTDQKVRQKKDDRNFDISVQITNESYSLELLQIMNKLLRSHFSDDSFFHIGGVQILYDIVGSDFSVGDTENPHASVMILNFWVFEGYQRGSQYNLGKTISFDTQILSAEDL